MTGKCLEKKATIDRQLCVALLVVILFIFPFVFSSPSVAQSPPDLSDKSSAEPAGPDTQPQRVEPELVEEQASGKDEPEQTETTPERSAPERSKQSVVEVEGEKGDGEDDGESRTDSEKEGLRLDLPRRSADGRIVYGVGLYLSQMSDLLPQGFRAVPLDQLAEALRSPSIESKRENGGRLQSAVYDVSLDGDTLTCNGKSYIEIQCRRSGQVRSALGRVNWAMIPPSRSAKPLGPSAGVTRLETDSNGTLFAVFQSGRSDQATTESIVTKIPVSWKYRGKRINDVMTFDLQLPRIPRSRIVLSAPVDTVVETLDGVLREASTSPPADADENSRDERVRWYEIEAGGLDVIRLRARSREVERINRLVVMRRQALQYDIAMSGVQWSHRMTLQIPRARQLPTIRIPNGVVTSVRVNTVSTTFSRRVNDDGSSSILIDSPLKPYTSTKKLTTLSITGSATWASEDPEFKLPRCELENIELIPSQTPIQVRATVEPNLSIVSWDLPDQWTQQVVGQTALGQTSLFAEGPPVASRDFRDETTESRPSDAWSTMRLAARRGWRTRETLLKMTIGDAESEHLTQANAQIRIEFDDKRLFPVRLDVQPGWNVTSITFPHSGRVIENPIVTGAGQRMLVWPESDDLDGNVLTMELIGRQHLGTERRVSVPSTWFVRTRDGQGTFLAAIVPPEQLNWSSETSMLDRVLTLDSVSEEGLSESERRFLDSSPPETLLVRRSMRDTPSLTLLRPNVSPDVTVKTQLYREGNQAVETLSIETNSIQLPDEFSIVFDAGDQRPGFRWSLVSDDEQEAISVPNSDVAESVDQGLTTHTVSLTEHGLRNLRLVGKRRYPFDETMTLALPSIRGAAKQDTEVLISSDWVVQSLSNSVLKVPAHPNSLPSANGPSGESSLPLLTENGGQPLSLFDRSPAASFVAGKELLPTRLRYDPISQPTIRVSRRERDPRTTVIWNQDIEISASSRGSDSIRARYRVSSNRPIEVRFDDDLQLISVSRNGRELVENAPKSGLVTIEPERDTDVIQLAWTRVRMESGWLRHCVAPSITVDGVLLDHRYRLTAASDTFALGSISRSSEKLSGGRTSLTVAAGSRRILVHRNLAIGIGWVIAGLVFAFAWYAALKWKFGFVSVVAVVILGGAASVLWWPWQLSLVGWIVLPSCAAGLLQASRVHQRGGESEAQQESNSERVASKKLDRIDPSKEFSVTVPVALVAVGFTLVAGATATFAQSAGTTSTPGRQDQSGTSLSFRDRPINVLVPVDSSVRQIGDKVYVSEETYRDYFASPDESTVLDPFFESANYRVEINSVRDPKVPASVVVTAEYVMHVERPGTLIRLPFLGPSVRRIELLQSDQSGIKQFDTDEKGRVIISLPRSDVFRLRLTLVPKITYTENEGEISLSVPSIHSSRLTVETDRTIDPISLDSSTESVTAQSEMGRWVTNLGPARDFQIAFRKTAEVSERLSLPMQRVYRIHAGKATTVMECEVTPSQKVNVGDQIQLIVMENPSAFVTTSAWRLDQTNILSPARYSLTFTKLMETAEPLSLAWRIPSAINDPTSQEERIVTNIPEVLPLDSTLDANPPIIGISGDVEVRVSPVGADEVSNMTSEEFYSHWNGYRATIDRAVSTESRLPELILLREKTPQPSAAQEHRLDVGPDRMQLEYNAEITDLTPSVQRRLLELPRGIRLQEVAINGLPTEYDITDFNGRQAISIRDDRTDGSISVRVRGVLQTPNRKRFQTPLVRLWPPIGGGQEYLITRQRESTVRVVSSPERAETIEDESYAFSMGQLRQELLGQGRIPVLRWASNSTDEASPAGDADATPLQPLTRSTLSPAQLIVSPRSNRVATDQLVALNFDQGRWVMNTAIRFGNTVPDFVDVEIPSRWCDSLDVQPDAAWMLRDSIDPEHKIVRVACDQDSMKQSALILHGELDNTDQDRISVPSIRILGEGRRRVYVAVPRRLTNEPIKWQRRSVKPSPLPQSWQGLLTGSDLQQLSDSDLYFADNENWSIDMLPLPNTSVGPAVVSADAKICARERDAIVICRWDIVPERLESIDIRLPPDAECLGAWSADQSVDATLINLEDASQEQTVELAEGESVLRVPLTLSRLTQAVEVMVRIPVGKGKQQNVSLPMPLGIEVPNNWVSVFTHRQSDGLGNDGRSAVASSGVDSIGVATEQSDAHAYALAQSVLQSIRRSLDSVAERRNVEVALWLESWVARYVSLAGSAGHRCDFTRDPESESVSDAEGWDAMDREMAVFVNRYLSDVKRYQAPRFAASRLKGFRLHEIHHLDPLESLPPLPRPSSGEAELRHFLNNLLTLAMVAGVFVLLWPLRDRVEAIIVHPAFWLALIGVSAIFVAPLPVAIAIIAAAVSLPTLQILAQQRWFEKG